MNKKGQTLVLFVFLIPIIILLFIKVFDYGLTSIYKNKAVTIIKESISYGLNNPNESEIKDYLNNNLDNIDKLEIIINEKITINIVLKPKYIFNNVIKLSYTGYKINNEIRIEKS